LHVDSKQIGGIFIIFAVNNSEFETFLQATAESNGKGETNLTPGRNPFQLNILASVNVLCTLQYGFHTKEHVMSRTQLKK
jgi:hypothetical protein